ncbi:uncharacterized protein LOC141848120 [Curcuma longa]|uniref:uncharacterized protein LOC141848120 n=1 Tax=Curcuma longa TaxID=136217 RepID=UPI003D9E7F78
MDPSSLAKRLWHMIRAVHCMIRKGFTKHNKLIMNLHLLLKRGKLAGKALTDLLLHHGHHPRADITGLSPGELNFFFHAPDDVEFSCSNTPSPAFFLSAGKRLKSGRRRRQADSTLDVHVAAALVKEFEILSLASPVPAAGRFGNSLLAAPRQLRITDSPFPAREEEENDGGRVDREAEAFIRRFYDQLRLQQSAPATPEFDGRRS